VRFAHSFSCLLIGASVLIPSLLPGESAAGQVPDTLQPAPAEERQQDSVPVIAPGGITPRGAFLRSMLIPGWGHAEVGSYVRGGFYFSAQSATVFMLVKTHSRLARATDRLELMESVVRRRLEASGVTDPRALEEALDGDPRVEDLRALKISRSEQRQDWMALGIFLVFLGGADAFVSAHLADFPAAVEIEATPSGALQVGVSVPLSF
jgi:hypothetical protein